MRLPSEERVIALDPIFGQMGIEAGRSIWSISELTMREKTFLCLVADVCHPHLGLPFELHIGMGMQQGLTTEDFREVLRHLGPYAGYTTCAVAFERLLEIARQMGIQEPMEPQRPEEGAALAPGYPTSILEDLRRLDGTFAAYVASHAHRVWGRGGLSRRERVIIWLAVDVLYQTLDASFLAHVDLALQSGVSRQDLYAVVRFLAEFGLSKAWRAMHALNSYFGCLLETRRYGPIMGEVEVVDYQVKSIAEKDESGISLIETRLLEKFTGGLVGTGWADHVRVVRADGSATFTGVERIQGTLDGRTGSFSLTATGSAESAGMVHGNWEVVLGSGTGELTGLRGQGEFTARGHHANNTTTYWFAS
jgi:alkylhydroperoxidase/carboxymuconolactone decarboxylase family protein YurZ